jgi:hypothetical protein
VIFRPLKIICLLLGLIAQSLMVALVCSIQGSNLGGASIFELGKQFMVCALRWRRYVRSGLLEFLRKLDV